MADRGWEAYGAAIGVFYDAAYGAAAWHDALAALNGLLHGSRSWLFFSRPGRLDAYMSMQDEGFHSPEGKAAAIRDPLHSMYRARQPGVIVRHSELEDIDAFRSRELWQDWLRPRDMDFGLQCTIARRGNDVIYLDLNRSMKQGDFAPADVEIVRAIVPHIQRAGDIFALVGEPRGTSSAHASPVAMLTVDADLRLIDMNAAATAIVDRHAALLSVSHGRVNVGYGDSARRLKGLIVGCTRPEPLPGGALLLEGDTDEQSRLVVSVAPLAQRALFGFPDVPLAAVFLRDIVGDEPALEANLISLFRLAPAHARLAAALSSGISLRQAAAERGVSYATARTYLDVIFRQTGTSRQSELVALLKTLEAGLRS